MDISRQNLSIQILSILLSFYYFLLNSDPISKQIILCVSMISVVGLFFFLLLRLRAEGKTKSPRLKALKEKEVLFLRGY